MLGAHKLSDGTYWLNMGFEGWVGSINIGFVVGLFYKNIIMSGY